MRGLRARTARSSRILVEGKHDAELIERVWGDDLRVEGVVVEMLDGVDDLAAAVRAQAPGPGRRLGVLVDHLVAGSKEWHEAAAVTRRPPSPTHVLVVGHPYVDIWQAVRPQRLGLQRLARTSPRVNPGRRASWRRSAGRTTASRTWPRAGGGSCPPWTPTPTSSRTCSAGWRS